MKTKVSSPMRVISGHAAGSFLVSYERHGELVSRAYVQPAHPRTEDQRTSSLLQIGATRNWSALTDEQRAAWTAHALRHWPEAPVTRAGYDRYQSAQYHRQAIGLGMAGEAPLDGPPPGVGRLDLAREFCSDQVLAFRIEAVGSAFFSDSEGLVGVADYLNRRCRLLLRVTAPLPSRARMPRLNEFRHVCGVGADSYLLIPADLSVPLLVRPRRRFEPGDRFGVQARLVSLDGIEGPTLQVVLEL